MLKEGEIPPLAPPPPPLVLSVPPPPPLPLLVPPPPGRAITAIGSIDVEISEMTIPYSLILQYSPTYTSSTVPLTEESLTESLNIINTKLKMFDLMWKPNLSEMIDKNNKSKTHDYLNRTLAMCSVIDGIATHIDNWIAEYDNYGIVIVDLLNITRAIADFFMFDKKDDIAIFKKLEELLFEYIDNNNNKVCRFIICIQNHLLNNLNFINFIRKLRTKLNIKCEFRYRSDAILILPAPDRASGDDMLALLAYTRIALRIESKERTGTRSRLVYTLLTNDYYGDFKSKYLKGNKYIQNFTTYLVQRFRSTSSRGSERSRSPISGPYSSGPSSSRSGPSSSTTYSSGPSSSRSGPYRRGGYGGTIKNKKLLKHNYHKKTRKINKKNYSKKHKTTIKAHRKYSKKHRTYKR